MSQLSTFRFAFVPPPPGTFVATLTGNSGGAVPPDLLNNINVISDTTQGTPRIVGNIGTNTLTLTFSNAVTGNTAIGLNSLIAAGAGANDNTSLGVSTLQSLTTGDNNTAIGFAALMDITTAGDNTAVGSNALTLATGAQNTAVGSGALATSSTAVANVAVGFDSLTLASTGSDNTAVGQNSGNKISTGANNTAIGVSTLQTTTGSNNIALGQSAGFGLVAAESSNIIIGNQGTAGDNNTIRIGTQGAGAGQQNKAFMAGITGVAVANLNLVTINTVTGQLGSEAATAVGIQIVDGDSGNATGNTITIFANTGTVNSGSSVTFVGDNVSTITFDVTDAGANTLIGRLSGNNALTGTDNTGLGETTLRALTTGSQNVAVGVGSLQSTLTGSDNVGVGFESLNLVTGSGNTSLGSRTLPVAISTLGNVAVGYSALNDFVGVAVTGEYNTAVGANSMDLLLTGGYNVALGVGSGVAFTGAESSNIMIGSVGVVADNNTLRIGNATGAGTGNLTKAFIAGIDGVNVGSTAKIVSLGTAGTVNQLGSTTITAGTGITVTPGANTITISSIGSGLTWSVITANQTAAVENGYFCNKAGTLALALPAASAVGDVIRVSNINTATGVQFTQAAGQQIFIGNTSTTLGATGTLTSSAVGDALEIVCSTANLTWQTISSMGNWTPA